MKLCTKSPLPGELDIQVSIHNPIRLGQISIVLLCFLSCLNGQDKGSQRPLFKVKADVVFLKVVVSDSLDRYVTGLGKEAFRVYEDNVQQTTSHFSQLSAPISVGYLFDISGSMGFNRNMRLTKNWFLRLLKSNYPNPEDEYFLITFNDKINLAQAFTNESGELQNDVAIQKPGGWTALYDAVYRGIDTVKQGKNEKKALILITDGEENSSRYSFAQIRELCRESSVQIYGIGVRGPAGGGRSVLGSLASLTGGRTFFGAGDLDYYIDLIHAELRNQYLLGYVSNNNARDGKWRRIKVMLDVQPGLPKLSIRTRDGYYGPKD